MTFLTGCTFWRVMDIVSAEDEGIYVICVIGAQGSMAILECIASDRLDHLEGGTFPLHVIALTCCQIQPTPF